MRKGKLKFMRKEKATPSDSTSTGTPSHRSQHEPPNLDFFGSEPAKGFSRSPRRRKGNYRPNYCYSAPSRGLAFKTVDSYIGKLRAIFSENGRGGEWDESLGATSKEVKQYLASVTAEQLGQGLTPQQARPVFLSKIVKVCEHIAGKIQSEKSASRLFTLARDQAIFKAAFFSGDRIADLMRVRTSDVCRLQSGALLMNHVWGKTLRDGRSNVFTLEKTGDSSTCPVVAIDWYVAISKYLSISLDGGFLFRSTSREVEVLAEQPSSAAVNTSFRRYLRKLGIDEGETLHGCRAGCAISLHMAGASEGKVMGHVGWFTKQTASHYMKIAKVTQPGGPATRLASGRGGPGGSQIVRREQRTAGINESLLKCGQEESSDNVLVSSVCPSLIMAPLGQTQAGIRHHARSHLSGYGCVAGSSDRLKQAHGTTRAHPR
ncbi:hypothetical protein Bbelb_393590 [Branchiostoma belcheri]|nr:hypothetical protein Bbelb_393590 [Branchiostoma belcheri]